MLGFLLLWFESGLEAKFTSKKQHLLALHLEFDVSLEVKSRTDLPVGQ